MAGGIRFIKVLSIDIVLELQIIGCKHATVLKIKTTLIINSKYFNLISRGTKSAIQTITDDVDAFVNMETKTIYSALKQLEPQFLPLEKISKTLKTSLGIQCLNLYPLSLIPYPYPLFLIP